MNFMTMPPNNVVAHICGYIQGAFAFGGTAQTVRRALNKDFPKLTEDQIDILMDEMAPRCRPESPPPIRILS